MKTLLLLFIALPVFAQSPLNGPTGNFKDPFASSNHSAIHAHDPVNPRNQVSPVRKDFLVSHIGRPSAKETHEKFMELWQMLQTRPTGRKGVAWNLKIISPLGNKGEFARYSATQGGHLKNTVSVLIRDEFLDPGTRVTVVLLKDGTFDLPNSSERGIKLVQYKEAADEVSPDSMGKEEFLNRLKSGEAFEVSCFRKEGCPSCFATGELGSLQAYRRCPVCDGTGSVPEVWLLRWDDSQKIAEVTSKNQDEDVTSKPSSGKHSEIPADIVRQIKEKAADKWQGDWRMISYELDTQCVAWLKVQKLKEAANETVEAIIKKASADWPDDYRMILYETNLQITAKRKLESE